MTTDDPTDFEVSDLKDEIAALKSKLDAEIKRTTEAMQLAEDRTARADSWMELSDELEAKLKACESRLHELGLALEGERVNRINAERTNVGLKSRLDTETRSATAALQAFEEVQAENDALRSRFDSIRQRCLECDETSTWFSTLAYLLGIERCGIHDALTEQEAKHHGVVVERREPEYACQHIFRSGKDGRCLACDAPKASL